MRWVDLVADGLEGCRTLLPPHVLMGGRTQAMVSDMLRHNFLNKQYLTLPLWRLFKDMPARVMVKFRVDCCFGCQAMEGVVVGVFVWLVRYLCT